MALRAQTRVRSSCPHNAGARRRPRDSPHVTLPSTWSAAPSPTCVRPRDKPRMKLTTRQRPVHGYPLRRLRAPAPHAARHNIPPAPVKPQGVPVRRPPPAKSSPESPRVHHQSLSSRPLIQERIPPHTMKGRRAGAPCGAFGRQHPTRQDATSPPAPVKPQGVPVRRPPTAEAVTPEAPHRSRRAPGPPQ